MEGLQDSSLPDPRAAESVRQQDWVGEAGWEAGLAGAAVPRGNSPLTSVVGQVFCSSEGTSRGPR